MLLKATDLMGRRVQARDGEVGTVDDLFFDDARWGVRYLVVRTGSWLSSRKVLLSPANLSRGVRDDEAVQAALTRKQIEDGPDIDADKPVSRHHEVAHALHYGYPHYWSGPFLWGAGIYPGVIPLFGSEAVPDEDARASEEAARREEDAAARSRLRSVKEVLGYVVETSGGTTGTLDDCVIDVDTGPWSDWWWTAESGGRAAA